MDRAPAASATTAVRDSLRENPAFAGIGEDLLDQIAAMLAQGRIARLLRKVPLFEALSNDDAVRILNIAETVTLGPGEVLFEEGRKGDTFYVVLGGRVELIKRGRDGSEQKLAVAREGEAFGEMALLNQTPRSATARAVESAQLLEISRQDFDSLLGADSFPVRMLRGISKTLWATSVRLAAVQAKGSDPREMVRTLSQVMQKSVLPATLPTLDGFAVMAQTGSSDAAAGESAWDWFRLENERVAFAVMRAFGEGLPGGYPLMLARTLLRELARDEVDPGKLLARVNGALCGARVGGAATRVECALVVPHDGELGWSAAGPASAAVVRGGGTVVDLPAEAPALGMDRNASFRTIAVPLMPGDALLAMARSAPGALARGKALLAERAGAEARELVSGVAGAIPADDPVTGEVFENTILLLQCVEPPEDEAPAGPGAAARASVRRG